MKKLLLASVLAIASFPGYVHAAEGIEEGVPCHDFSGAAHDRCAKSVTHCQQESGYREPFQDEKAKAHYYACMAKQPDPEISPVAFKPWRRAWQCSDIRVTETVTQRGIVNYDLAGTIWGGSQFALDIQRGTMWFNGRPCAFLGGTP